MLCVLAMRMLPRGVRLEWFLVLECSTALRRPKVGIDRHHRWLGLPDTELLSSLGKEENALRKRLEQGDRVAALVDGPELVAYLWLRTGLVDEDGVLFVLGPDEAWLYDAEVAGNHRGAGRYRTLFGSAMAELAAEGVARVLLAVDHLNQPSVRAHVAGGAEPIGSVLAVTVAGHCLRREHWGRRARWRLYRGAAATGLPPLGRPQPRPELPWRL